MLFGARRRNPGGPRRKARQALALLLLAGQLFALPSAHALPKRLVLLVDGVAYRDMKALQAGVTYKDLKGRQFHRQAFQEGYFPVSRDVSSFPSASDVAWTEIFGDRPLPGYQRTYFSSSSNQEVFGNGVTTTMEYEAQMTWQVKGSLRRALGYIFPVRTFNYELREMMSDFLNTTNHETYYAMMRATDDAQHLSGDIFSMLCTLDKELGKLRAVYRAREGRELEVLLISDHGNNHAGPGKLVPVRAFLKKAGYQITQSLAHPGDVVLPTAGIESWVEIHNAPEETERLAQLLCHMEGVDLVTARVPGRPNRFIVRNAKCERALIDWNREKNEFRYTCEVGDPLDYRPVSEALAKSHQSGTNGFASADAWMAETVAHHYPLVLERIARGHTRVTLNPATILISLNNRYVHAGWWVKKGSELVTFGGTHGALDDINSDGIVLSSFAPTKDTSTQRIAGLYNGFPGLRDFRAEEDGAEWVSCSEQALTSIARAPLDKGRRMLRADQVFLRVWSPRFAQLGEEARLEISIQRARQFLHAQIRPGSPAADASEQTVALSEPIWFPEQCSYERVYALPSAPRLEPQTAYWITGRIRGSRKAARLFKFTFRTDSAALPIAY